MSERNNAASCRCSRAVTCHDKKEENKRRRLLQWVTTADSIQMEVKSQIKGSDFFTLADRDTAAAANCRLLRISHLIHIFECEGDGGRGGGHIIHCCFTVWQHNVTITIIMLLFPELFQAQSLLCFVLLNNYLSGTRFIGCTLLLWRASSRSSVDQFYGHYAACVFLSPLGTGNDNSHSNTTQWKTSVPPGCKCTSFVATVAFTGTAGCSRLSGASL